MWKMPVARAPAFLLRRILSCAIAVAVLLSASFQDVHGQGCRVGIASHPHVARAYDVKDDVVFVLFANGRAVKRATEPEVLERVLTKIGGLYSDERFLAKMEAFLDQK